VFSCKRNVSIKSGNKGIPTHYNMHLLSILGNCSMRYNSDRESAVEEPTGLTWLGRQEEEAETLLLYDVLYHFVS